MTESSQQIESFCLPGLTPVQSDYDYLSVRMSCNTMKDTHLASAVIAK